MYKHIDIAAHIVAPRFRSAVTDASHGKVKLISFPALDRLDARFAVMDCFPGVTQLLSIADCLEEYAIETKPLYEVTKLANDELAELVADNPKRFVGALAMVPWVDPDRSLREAERAIRDLRLNGIMINAGAEHSLDKPEYMPLYEMMAHYDLPIFIHPIGGETSPDYRDEDAPRYQTWRLWGWPYQSTLAMTRLVFSGVFDKFPGIKFVIHHAGAMVPFNEWRIETCYALASERREPYMDALKHPPLDYFRMFYVDTANAGAAAGLQCAVDFYGSDRVLFGTDCPWGTPYGYGNTLYERTIGYVDQLNVSDQERHKITVDNASQLFRLAVQSS